MVARLVRQHLGALGRGLLLELVGEVQQLQRSIVRVERSFRVTTECDIAIRNDPALGERVVGGHAGERVEFGLADRFAFTVGVEQTRLALDGDVLGIAGTTRHQVDADVGG